MNTISSSHRAASSERRQNRSAYLAQALKFQLAACCTEGEISAMVIADSDGILLASSGDGSACEEVAARMAVLGCRINEFSGTLLGPRNGANEPTLEAGPRNGANEPTLEAGPRNGANEPTLEAGYCEKWDVQMSKFRVEDADLLVCAVGGSAEQRQRQISRGAQGARRILRAA
ncbi:MAG: hypothetical protein KBG15_00150 [Kofleriaceae bacterium]|nr:hypothetical protein [Kofleriaceae bacterium]